MPHYFFDLRDGSNLVRDEEGCWFRDFAAAEREAAETAASMLLDAHRADHNPTKITIEVRDETADASLMPPWPSKSAAA